MRKRKYIECVCTYPGCKHILNIRSDQIKTHTKKCSTHSHTKRPYESIYQSLLKDWRKLDNTLTYEQFLDFTSIKNCHYCLSYINWIPYSTVQGKFISRAYYLDRKDNNLGYSLTNCVTCCTTCNRAKGNRYSYEEWYGMTEYFRRLK